MPEFSNTDAELARCIKSRIQHELAQLPHNRKLAKEIVQEYMIELCTEIINEES